MAYRKILLRRDTASNWTTEDPTLSSGEIGYETTTGRFKIGDGSTAWTSLSYFMGSLDDVGNVTITSAASGQFLKWNGTAWVNDAIDLGTDTTGNYMSGVSAGTGISVTHTPGEGSTATVGLNATLDNLSNVNAPTPSDGQFLKYVSGSSEWQPANIPTINNLDDVGDVTITSAAGGQFLKWNGTAWVNDAIDLGTDTTGNYMSDVSAGTGISVTHTPGEGSTATVGLNATLDNLSNVNAPTPSDGQFLKYVAGSSEWQPANIPTINNLDDVGDVTITSASADQFLKWNGSAWVNANIPQINALDDIADVAITSAATNDVLAWSGSAWVNVNDLTVDNLTVSGDLTVNGTTTTLNTETLAVEDNIITLNSNVSGAPSANAGIEIERGSASNVLIRWNETTDTWQLTEDGTTYSDIATALDIAGVAINALDEIGDVSISSATAGQFLKWNGTAWVNDNVPIVSVLDDVGDVDVSSKSSGQFLKWNGTAWIADNVPLISTLDDVGDVTLSSTTVGQTLAYNGSGWVNSSSIRDNEVKFLMEVI